MEFPWIVLVSALLTSRLNVCGDPGMTTFSAALHAARTVGLTNEPTSALSATKRLTRATTPPPKAARAADWPRGFPATRAAPCSVSGPVVQSAPSSPSALFARKLYAGVTDRWSPSVPSGPPHTRQRAYNCVSFDDWDPDPCSMRNEWVANCAPRATFRTIPVAKVNVGSFTTVCCGPGATKKRWTKLNCTIPGSTTHVPPRLAERYMSDCADSGTAVATSRANEACLITDPPGCSFRIPHSALSFTAIPAPTCRTARASPFPAPGPRSPTGRGTPCDRTHASRPS